MRYLSYLMKCLESSLMNQNLYIMKTKINTLVTDFIIGFISGRGQLGKIFRPTDEFFITFRAQMKVVKLSPIYLKPIHRK